MDPRMESTKPASTSHAHSCPLSIPLLLLFHPAPSFLLSLPFPRFSLHHASELPTPVLSGRENTHAIFTAPGTLPLRAPFFFFPPVPHFSPFSPTASSFSFFFLFCCCSHQTVHAKVTQTKLKPKLLQNKLSRSIAMLLLASFRAQVFLKVDNAEFFHSCISYS